MITAVMQPYLFPYIGYYQLVYASDYFIFYDDVNYIKRGYVNRNNILINNESKRFSLPVKKASQNIKINELYYEYDTKIIKMIENAYKKKPFFSDVFPFLQDVFLSEERNVAELNARSVFMVFDFLGLTKNFSFSSDFVDTRKHDRSERLIELTKLQGADHYVNSPGGRELYEKQYFKKQNVKLSFIETEITSYDQSISQFVPYLSIIDILMHCSKCQIVEMLKNYKLV